jgi:hypothetical protein
VDDIDIIAAIYDAIIDPSSWDEAIRLIVAATNSISGALIVHQTDTVHFTALCNVDPSYADAYARIYSKISPLAAEAATIAPGEVRAGTRITQTGSFQRRRFIMSLLAPKNGPMWSALDSCVRRALPDASSCTDRLRQFRWIRRNGSSWKDWRPICSGR